MKLKTLVICGALTLAACGDADEKPNTANNQNSVQNNQNSVQNNQNSVQNNQNSVQNNANNGGGDFNSSLPDDKVLGTATADELNTLCADSQAWTEANAGEFCKLTAMIVAAFSGAESDEMLQAACDTALTDCIADPMVDTNCDPNPNPGCTATVGELEACLNDFVGVLEATSCADLTLDMETMPGQPPASCETYEAKCPTPD